MTLKQHLYHFLRNGDEKLIQPEDWPEKLQMELGAPEHRYLASQIAAWLKRNYKYKRRK